MLPRRRIVRQLIVWAAARRGCPRSHSPTVSRFSALVQVELKIVRDQTLNLPAAIVEIDAAIETAARNLDGYDGRGSIKGSGPRSAAVLLSGIGNVADFDSADKLAAYLGIVPKVSCENASNSAPYAKQDIVLISLRNW